MASKQTRRSISVRGTTYSLLRDFCSHHERSMSDVVEELLSRILEDGEKRAPRPKTVAPLVARAAAPARPVATEPDRAAVRVVPLPRAVPAPVVAPQAPAAAPVPKAAATQVAAPVPNPTRPAPVPNAGRPAPTRVETVKDTPRSGNDYRAIRF